MWEWDECATPALTVALVDPEWRVREMAAMVVARHLVGDALPAVSALRDDPVTRVRTAANRAVVRLTRARRLSQHDGQYPLPTNHTPNQVNGRPAGRTFRSSLRCLGIPT